MYPYFRHIIQKIKQNKRIKLAVLFGSHAKKLATKESDIDIFIESKSKGIKKEIENLSSRINVKIGKFDKKNPLVREIIKNHVIIKGVELYYAKIRFFEKT